MVSMTQKLSEKKRDLLFDKIVDECVCYSVGTASVEEIDKINILQATFLAMRRAVDGLSVKPDIALIDGNKKPGLDIEQWDIVKGDATSANIAAASIIAKVSRIDICSNLPKSIRNISLKNIKVTELNFITKCSINTV